MIVPGCTDPWSPDWRVRIGEAEASLKMRMIERGYSPEQIAQVLQTKMDKAGRGRCRDNDFLAPAST